MRFTCETLLFSQACSNVQRAVSSKNSIPAVEGIFLKALGNEVILTGYDLEMGINTSVKARVEENGSIILNAKVFCEIIRKIPGDMVTIDSDERNLAVIKGGGVEYSLIGIAGEEYPDLPTVSGGFPIVIKQNLLSEMVKQTIFSVSAADTKAVHTGVKFEIGENVIKLIAIDGFRMAIRNEEIDYSGEIVSFIVPAKTLAEVIKLFNDEDEESYVSLGIGKRHIIFETSGYSVVSRLLDGEFLNYKTAIPTVTSTSVLINTKEFIECIERVSIIITDKMKSPIRCVFEDGNVLVSSVTAIGSSHDSMKADITGDSVEIGLNNRFITEALRASGCEDVRLEMNGAVSPVLMLPDKGDKFLYLILPVRLKSE